MVTPVWCIYVEEIWRFLLLHAGNISILLRHFLLHLACTFSRVSASARDSFNIRGEDTAGELLRVTLFHASSKIEEASARKTVGGSVRARRSPLVTMVKRRKENK
jgi:hypothetical protein